MIADFFTKPLQGALFRKLRTLILNLPDNNVKPSLVGQECVETNENVPRIPAINKQVAVTHTNVRTPTVQRTYADVVMGSYPDVKEGSSLPSVTWSTTTQQGIQ